MLIDFKEQIIRDFTVPSFVLNEGEILIIKIPSGPFFKLLRDELIYILVKSNSNIKYVKNLNNNSIIDTFFPITIEKFLDKCDEKSVYKNMVYKIDGVTKKTKLRKLTSAKQKLLSLLKTLTNTKHIALDLIGVDLNTANEIYKILKINQSNNGTVILFDTCNDFENSSTRLISVKYLR